MKARNRLNVDDKDEAGFSKCSTANFEIGCQNASASIALTQLLRLPLELYSGKSLLMCFLYLLKIFSYANIGGGSQATRLLQKGSPLGKVWEPLIYINPASTYAIIFSSIPLPSSNENVLFSVR